MPITVEFYGVARLRAGHAQIEVEGTNLGDVLLAAERACPALCGAVTDGGTLLSAYRASINGLEFTTDPSAPLKLGDSVLILAADAGG